MLHVKAGVRRLLTGRSVVAGQRKGVFFQINHLELLAVPKTLQALSLSLKSLSVLFMIDNSCFVCFETGRHAVASDDRYLQKDFRPIEGQVDHSSGEAYQGITEYSGRFSVETGHGRQDRVGSVERKLSLGLHTVTVGRTNTRLICQSIQSSDRKILLSMPRRPVGGDGRTSCELAFRGAVCIPTDHPYIGGGLQDHAGATGTTGLDCSGLCRM